MTNIRTTDLPAVFASRDLPSGTSSRILERVGISRVTNGVYRRDDQGYDYGQLAVAIHRSLPGSILAGLSAAYFHNMRLEIPDKVFLISQQRFRRDLIVSSRAKIQR